MARRRFLADEIIDDRALLKGEHAAHLVRVLRARVGQEFEIGFGDQVRLGTIVSVTDDRVEFELGTHIEAAISRSITMALAIYKFDRLEWAIEKCTELGATRIVPVVSRRTDAHLAAAALKRVDRWRRIAHEASQQSRRSSPPRIDDPVKLKQLFDAEREGQRIVLAETEREIQLCDLATGSEPLNLAVGPEGGWAPEELRTFGERGWTAASLGRTILRAETAAIAALAIVQSISD